jgi:hypothetical protein
VIVRVNEPVGAFAGRVTVKVEVKSGAPEGTLNVPLLPEGRPDTDSETSELKPRNPDTSTEYDAIWPWLTVRDAGLTSTRKSLGGPTTSVTAVVRVLPPPLPVMVSE